MIKEYIREFEEKTGAKVVYLTKSGSKLYGTDTPSSDTDMKGIFIPSKTSVLLKQDMDSYVRDTNNSNEKNSKEDVDFTLHSIYSFFNHLSKSETGAVDVLFSMFRSDTILYENKDFTDLIKKNKHHFLNRNMKSFVGYALGQTKKFGIKGARYKELDTFMNFLKDTEVSKDDLLVTHFDSFKSYIKEQDFKYIKFVEAPGPRGSGTYSKIEYISVLGKMFEGRINTKFFLDRVILQYNQFGNRTKTVAETESKTDFKALSHSLRIASEVKELLETGFIKFPLVQAQEIKDIKSGNCNIEATIDQIQDVLDTVDEILLKSELPDEANKEIIKELLILLLDKEYR